MKTSDWFFRIVYDFNSMLSNAEHLVNEIVIIASKLKFIHYLLLSFTKPSHLMLVELKVAEQRNASFYTFNCCDLWVIVAMFVENFDFLGLCSF